MYCNRTNEKKQKQKNRSAKIYGTSGGALTGCLLFLDIDLDALAEYVYICAAKARSSIRGAFLLRDYCRGAITQFCPQDAHEKLEGKLEISITRLFPWYKNLRVNHFPSYDFLVQSLLCSACITPLAGLPMWLEGHGLCFDGGVSDLQLLKGLARNGTFCKLHCRKTNPKNLVVVCPFYSSRADIRPSKYVPLWWAFYPPQPYKLKELFELGHKDAHMWADKQEEASPSSSPRAPVSPVRDEAEGEGEEEEREEALEEAEEAVAAASAAAARRERGEEELASGNTRGFVSEDDEDLDWDWRRREKAAAAAAAGGAKAGSAAWRAAGAEAASRRSPWFHPRTNSSALPRTSLRNRSTSSVERESVSGDESGEEGGSGSGGSEAKKTQHGAPARLQIPGGGGGGGFTEWAAECQEWASLSAEAAARRAVAAARAAASKADAFVHHEADVAFEYASAGFCEAQAAAEAMRRVARKQAGVAAEYAMRASDAVDDLAEAIEGVHTGRFQLHRLALKWMACLVIYFELLCQAAFYAIGAASALLLPGVPGEKLWERCVEFCRPLPRVLLQPVPGVRVGAKINGRTAKVLGNISVTYRVLCYLVHMEVKV